MRLIRRAACLMAAPPWPTYHVQVAKSCFCWLPLFLRYLRGMNQKLDMFEWRRFTVGEWKFPIHHVHWNVQAYSNLFCDAVTFWWFILPFFSRSHHKFFAHKMIISQRFVFCYCLKFSFLPDKEKVTAVPSCGKFFIYANHTTRSLCDMQQICFFSFWFLVTSSFLIA